MIKLIIIFNCTVKNPFSINGAVYNWLKSYQSNRYQSTKFGKRISVALLILCGVPQGSIHGPILFSICINDIVDMCINSVPFLFADDEALSFKNVDRTSYSNIKNEIRKVDKWARVNKLCLNASKTKFMVFDCLDNLDVIDITTSNN